MQGIMKKAGLVVLAYVSTVMLAYALTAMTVPMYSMIYLVIFFAECASLLKVNRNHREKEKDPQGTFLCFMFFFMRCNPAIFRGCARFTAESGHAGCIGGESSRRWIAFYCIFNSSF